jgi:hypothetical protein
MGEEAGIIVPQTRLAFIRISERAHAHRTLLPFPDSFCRDILAFQLKNDETARAHATRAERAFSRQRNSAISSKIE